MNLIGTLDWAEANVTLDGRPFRRGDWPQIVPAVEAMDRGTGRTIILMMPPQRGKTLAGQLRLARNLAVSPRRQLWYSKTHNDARSVSDSKLGPLLKACPAVQRVTYTDPDARGRGLLFRFHNSPVELLSADVVAHRNSRSGQELYLDEAWQYEPRAIAEIYARGESYRWRRQVNIMSTAPDRGHEFDVLWESSSRNEWHVACPHCGHVFAPVWSRDHFVWEESLEDDGRINVEASAPTVRLKSPCCGVVTAWSPAICKAMNDPQRGAGYKPLNVTPDPSVDGFRFNVLATDDWAKFAREWMRAMNAMRAGDRQPMREVRLKKLCIPWDEARDVGANKIDAPVGNYRFGDAWPDEAKDEDGTPWRFAFVDVQKTHFWAVVRAFSRDGRSRLVAFDKLLSEHDVVDFVRRHGVMFGQWYEHQDVDGRWKLVPRSRVVLDTNYNPGLVQRICSAHGFNMLSSYKRQAFKHADKTLRIYDEGQLVDPMQGTARQGEGRNVWLFRFVGDACKDRLEILRSQTGADGNPTWSVPTDVPMEYRRQLNAEEKRQVRRPDGSWEYRWVRGPKDNHALDCEAGIIALASMKGLFGEDWVTVEEAEKIIDPDGR